MLPYFVAIVGYARTGKDTAAELLADAYGYKRIASADKLKQLALEANPLVPLGNGKSWRLASLVRSIGWEVTKDQYPGVREFLVSLGQGGRTVFGADFWVKQVLAESLKQSGPWVLSDCRFLNEAQAVRNHAADMGVKSLVIRIHRPGAGPASDFEREVDRIVPDIVVANDGTKADFCNALVDAIELA